MTKTLWQRTILRILGSAMLSMAATAGWTQNGFDCGRLLKTSNVGDPSMATTQLLSANPVYVEVPPEVKSEITNPNDPIALVENLEREGAATLHSANASITPDGEDPKILGCAVLVAEFRVGERVSSGNFGEPVGLSGAGFEPEKTRFPILLVQGSPSVDADRTRFGNWMTQGYRIGVKFDSQQAGDGALRFPLTADVFVGENFFTRGQQSWADGQLVAVQFEVEELEPALKDLFSQANVSNETMLVFCAFSSCEELHAALDTVQPVRGIDQPEEAETADVTSGNPEPSDGPQINTQTAPQNGTLVVQPAPRVEFPEFNVQFSYVYADPETQQEIESAKGPDGFANLQCLLAAITVDLFESSPDCGGTAFEELSKRGALIRIDGSGRWQIVDGARNRAPVEVFAQLPPGETGTLCDLTLQYLGQDGTTVDLRMEPVVGSSPRRFQARLDAPAFVESGRVKIRIVVNDPSRCGGASREVDVESAETLRLNLVEGAARNIALLTVFAPDAAQLDQEMSLRVLGAGTIGQSFLNLAASAYHGLELRLSDKAKPINSAQVVHFNGDGSSSTILSLDSDTMRSGVAARFLGLPGTHRDNLGTGRMPLRADTMTRTLARALKAASESGVSDLYVQIVGQTLQSSARFPAAPCKENVFLELRQNISDVATAFELDLHLSIFPIVAPEPLEDLPYENLRRVSLSEPSGGLFRCRDATPGLAIYPYYVDSQRAPMDILPRYSAAVSDQMLQIFDRIDQ